MNSNIRKRIFPYYPLILLILVFSFRFLTITKSPNIQENFETEVTLINPLQVNDSQIVLYTSGNYKVLSYRVPSHLEVGDKIKLVGDKYYSNIYADNVEVIGPSRFKRLYEFKNHLITQSNTHLPEPHASLFNGIMWGTKPDVSDDFRNKLIAVGIIHIIVVSGYNISILFSVALKSFSKFGLRYSVAFGILLSLIYALVVGFDPPVVRALLMGVLLGVGRAYGQVKNVTYVLFVSVLLMLIYTPSLIYSVSLQLTFFATLGILLLTDLLKKPLTRHFWFNSLPEVIQEDFLASISAQIFVIPLLLYYFKGISLVSFIINPLILWTIPLIMVLGAVFLMSSLLGIAEVALLLSYVLTAFLGLVIKFVNFFSFIPKGYVTFDFNIYYLVLCYLFIFTAYYYLSKGQKKDTNQNC